MAERVVDLLVAIAAVIAALGVIAKTPYIRRPLFFVVRQLAGDPISQWFRRLVHEEATRVIKTELKEPNGGASIPDLSAQIKELRAYTHDGIHFIGDSVTPLKGQVDMLWERAGFPPLPSQQKDNPA